MSITPDTFGQLVLEADNPAMFFAAHEREFLVGIFDALLQGDHKAAARAHLEHGRPDTQASHHEVRVESTYWRETERFSTRHARRTTRVSHLFDAIGRAPVEHLFSTKHGRIASRSVMLSRSLHAIEHMAHEIAPDVDV